MNDFTMHPANPNEVDFTLEITMKLKDWRKLQDQLKNDHPASILSGRITDMVYFADKHWNERDLEK